MKLADVCSKPLFKYNAFLLNNKHVIEDNDKEVVNIGKENQGNVNHSKQSFNVF